MGPNWTSRAIGWPPGRARDTSLRRRPSAARASIRAAAPCAIVQRSPGPPGSAADHAGRDQLQAIEEARDLRMPAQDERRLRGHPVIGLGPVGDIAPVGAARPDTRREAVLARLLSDALSQGATEIVLDEATMNRLTNRDQAPAPRTAEIYVRVLAAGPAAASRRFVLAVSGGSQDALSTSGRFVPLLGQPAPAREAGDSALVAELAVRPRLDALASVAAETGLAAYRIPVGVPLRHGDLDLADLTVSSDGRHLAVWSRSPARRVLPVLCSRIALPLLPPAAQFLAMVGHAGERPGTAGHGLASPRRSHPPYATGTPGSRQPGGSSRSTWPGLPPPRAGGNPRSQPGDPLPALPLPTSWSPTTQTGSCRWTCDGPTTASCCAVTSGAA
jgi:Lantibiotic dehydratase, N terminus